MSTNTINSTAAIDRSIENERMRRSKLFIEFSFGNEPIWGVFDVSIIHLSSPLYPKNSTLAQYVIHFMRFDSFDAWITLGKMVE
jgi:hypothetical protein